MTISKYMINKLKWVKKTIEKIQQGKKKIIAYLFFLLKEYLREKIFEYNAKDWSPISVKE